MIPCSSFSYICFEKLFVCLHGHVKGVGLQFFIQKSLYNAQRNTNIHNAVNQSVKRLLLSESLYKVNITGYSVSSGNVSYYLRKDAANHRLC